MKTLKFSLPLPDMVLSGEKTVTRRINDEKGIIVGDELSLCYKDGIEFAKAIAVRVKEMLLGEVTEEDFEGHERFVSTQAMYKWYAEVYSIDVGPQTKLKIIEFKLAKKK